MPTKITKQIKGACGIAPETQPDDDVNTGAHAIDSLSNSHAVLVKVAKLWEPGKTITYSFFGGTQHQKDAVNRVAPEWTWYAKLNLVLQDDYDNAAIVRINFDPNGGSWSSVGKGALAVKNGGITMNLGWIEDSPTISDNDRGTILHEWGHALGLMHEHQSPARDGTITLKEDAVYQYYHDTQSWDNALIKAQILDVFNLDDVSNYSKLDTHSIMMYFMPGRLNVQNITVNVNNQLSDMDKAYMVINYTRSVLHDKAKEWTLEKALLVAGVPAEDQKAILSLRDDPASIRAYFASWNKEARANDVESDISQPKVPRKPSPKPEDDEFTRLMSELQGQLDAQPVGQSSTTSDASTELDVYSALFSAFTNPVFGQLVSSVVNTVLTQNGLHPEAFPPQISNDASHTPNPSTRSWGPHTTQRGLLSGLTDFLTNPIVTKAITTAVGLALDLHEPSSVSEGIQHSLLSNVKSILGNAAVHTALLTTVDSILTQRGLSPATTAQYPVIQQDMWSTLIGVVTHPVFQEAMTAALGAALDERGIKPTPAPSDTESDYSTDIGELLYDPLIGTTFISLVNEALSRRGVDPNTLAKCVPKTQMRIWAGVASKLEHSAFHKLVNTLINSTLTEHGLDTGPASGGFSDDVQQGIRSRIVQAITDPLFKKVVRAVVEVALTQQPTPKPENKDKPASRPAPDTTITQDPASPSLPASDAKPTLCLSKGPIIQQPLTGPFKTAPAQHVTNLHPLKQQNSCAVQPEHGIVSDSADVKNPTFYANIQHSLKDLIGNELEKYEHNVSEHDLSSETTEAHKDPSFRRWVASLINDTLAQHVLHAIGPHVGDSSDIHIQRGTHCDCGTVPTANGLADGPATMFNDQQGDDVALARRSSSQRKRLPVSASDLIATPANPNAAPDPSLICIFPQKPEQRFGEAETAF